MALKPHPILLEISEQIPKTSATFQNIQKREDHAITAKQARLEMRCLQKMEGTIDGDRSARSVLEESGYADWLEDLEGNDRLRVIGALELISELAEELAED